MLNFDAFHIRTYRGFANGKKAVILGHIIHGATERAVQLRRSSIRHAYQVGKLFFLKPKQGQSEFTISFKNQLFTITSQNNGFFYEEIELKEPLKAGWHRYFILNEKQEQVDEGLVLQPCPTDFAIVSDIDDTYLVSHTNNAIKKIGIMLFRNVTKRKPFIDAVKHYRQLLSWKTTEADEANLFINVSSSEWNLFPLLSDFLRFHRFPNAVLLLDELKSGAKQLLFSGRGDHNHKLHKIEQMLQFYPDKQFILIGDDTQRDPFIYNEIANKYPNRIAFVQIRQVGKGKKAIVQELLNNMAVPTNYFTSSTNAMQWLNEL